MNTTANFRHCGAFDPPPVLFISQPSGRRGESEKMRCKRTFQTFQTLEQAQAFIKSRKGRRTTLTLWSNSDGKESGFIVWYFA